MIRLSKNAYLSYSSLIFGQMEIGQDGGENISANQDRKVTAFALILATQASIVAFTTLWLKNKDSDKYKN